MSIYQLFPAMTGQGGLGPAPLNAPPAASPLPGVQPGATPGTILARRVVIFGVDDGLFEYEGTPAAGNPPVAWAVPPGVTTDPYGNSLPVSGGFATMPFHTPSDYGQLAAGKVVLAGGGTPWTIDGAALSPNTALAIWQGTASATGTFFISDLGYAVAETGGLPETPHTMTITAPDFAAGGTTPTYELEPVGANGRTRLGGAINITGNVAAGATFYTLPAGYTPAATKFLVCYSGGTNVYNIQVAASGAMTVEAAAVNGDFFVMDGVTFPLD
jgi:hypothetical protein